MATHEVVWSLRAVADVSEITIYIAADNPEAAERWEGGLIDRIQRIAEFPHSGRVVPELRREDLREVMHGR